MREIKLIDQASQTFSVILSGKRCKFFFRYNDVANRWTFSLSVNEILELSGRFVILEVDLVKRLDLGIGILYAVDYLEAGVLPEREELPSGAVRLYQHDTGEAVVTSI